MMSNKRRRLITTTRVAVDAPLRLRGGRVDASRYLRLSAFICGKTSWSSAAATPSVHERAFQWQEGYSIFPVSARALDEVADYMERQEDHHRQQGFADELKGFLDKHGIQYDAK
jgi:hypothetical protein